MTREEAIKVLQREKDYAELRHKLMRYEDAEEEGWP